MQNHSASSLSALTLCLVLALQTAWAADPVYRWVDKNGVIHYGAKSPDKDAKPASLPGIQTYSPRGGRLPPILQTDTAAAKATSNVKEVRILAPVQDEIFRDPQTPINVSVAVLPGLPEGAGVIFYLDGAAKNARPLPGTSTSFSGVDRGEHTVAAAVVDALGKEIMRSAPITFHSKPPIAR